MKLVFHADDFGLSHSFNYGIQQAHKNGVLNSTSYRIDGTSFDEAVEMGKSMPGLGKGVHLNLVEGLSLRAQRSDRYLTAPDGSYRLSFLGLLRVLNSSVADDVLKEVEAEYRFQIESVMRAGIKVDHLNSHQHSHVIPRLFRVVCQLAQEYRIPYVRLQREPYHLVAHRTGEYLKGLPWFLSNQSKWLVSEAFLRKNLETARKYGVKTNDYFIGLIHAGQMDGDSTLKAIRKCRDAEVIEILMHPCLLDPNQPDRHVAAYLEGYVSDRSRKREYETLCDPEFQKKFERMGGKALNYAELGGLSAG